MVGHHRNQLRRPLALSVAFVLVAAVLQVLGSAPASAAPCADPQTNPTLVAGFEIDGNLCLNTTGTTGDSEWDTVGGQPAQSDPSGSTDTTAFSGTAEGGWPWTPSQISGSNPSGNADITHVFASAEIANDEVIAYIGWERAATQGTVGFYVELNQQPNRLLANGQPGPVPNRTDGDLRLRFIQQGNTLLALDAAYTWASSGPDSGTWTPAPVTGYAARTNGVAVSNLPNVTPNPMPAGTFAEVAVNLSDLFAGIGGCSGEFGYLNLRSVSSLQATNPPLQDWVRPIDLGVPSTCPAVVLQKRWLNGAEGDTAGLSIDGATVAPGFATSTASGLPDFTDTTNRATAVIEPGAAVALAETLGENTGTYTSTIGCDRGVLDPVPGRTGSFTMPPGFGAADTVTCTFTNTRTQATLELTKVWASSTPGDTADLTIGTEQRGITGPTTSTAPASTTIEAPIFSGEPVTVVEDFGDDNASSYEALTECTANILDFDEGDFGANFTVPDEPTDVACTITNTAIPARLTLSKVWVNGAPGDTAEMTITSDVDPTRTDSGVATVPAGGEGRSPYSAILAAVAGEAVTLSEVLPAPNETNVGMYQPIALECDGEPLEFDATGAGATATFTVPSSEPVDCTYTNEARYAVELTKEWGANAVAGDTADLTITNETTPDADGVTATAPDPPDTPASVIAAPDDTIHVEETLSNSGAYAATLSCVGVTPGSATGTSGSFTVPPDLVAGTTIRCAFRNTAQYTVSLTKAWGAGAVAGDTAELTIRNGTTAVAASVVATAPNPPDVPATVSASAGDYISLEEVTDAASVGYDTTLACTSGPLRTVVPGTTDEFEVPFDLPAGTAIRCTFTNTGRLAPPPQTPVSRPVIRTVTSHPRVTPGTRFHDRIHVRNLAGPSGATAVARLYGPFRSRAAASCQPRFQARAHTFNVVNGWNRTPTVTVRRPGVYTWKVTLLANAANSSATHPCGQVAETTVVAKRPYVAPIIKGGFSGSIDPSRLDRRMPVTVRMPGIGMRAVVRKERVVRGRMTLPGDVGEVGWLRNSAAFGDKIGAAVVGGHVSDRRDRPGAMVKLGRAQAGQRITVVKDGRRYRYKVVRKTTFDRHQRLPQRFFTTTGRHRLVLVSCTDRVVYPNGRFHYTRYVVVVAKRLGP